MKRISAVVLLLAALLCGCGGKPVEERRIALVVKGTDTEFWQAVYAGAQAAAAEDGFTVTLYGPRVEKDYTEQIGIMEQVVSSQPDAIMLAASDYQMMAQPVQDAIDAGIPVIMVDSDVQNDQTAAFVGTDNTELGNILAEELLEEIPGEGTVGIVSFVQESYPAVQREEGFRSVMEEDGRLRLLDTVYCQSDVAQARQLTEKLVEENPDLVAIAALNAQSAEGAAQALGAMEGIEVPLFSIDCTPELAMYMEDGVVASSLLQNPYQMGYYGVVTANEYLSGEAVEDLHTDIYVVDRSMIFEAPYEQLIFPFES